MNLKIALVGNPNVGKTSLYNRLTRSLEHVGNWHGVTVSKVSKQISFDGKVVQIDDLPGLYSLCTCSYEEDIARDAILEGSYDLIVNVCEVNNLCRNLYLTLQLLELNIPVVLVVNMVDELKKRGQVINTQLLSSRLGIPVFAVSAKYKIDSEGLINSCLEYVKSSSHSKADLGYLKQLPISQIAKKYAKGLTKANLNPTYAAIKLLERDPYVAQKLLAESDKLLSVQSQARVAMLRYQFIEKTTAGVIQKISSNFERGQEDLANPQGNSPKPQKSRPPAKLTNSRSLLYLENAGKIDRIVLNRYLALPIFLAVMALIFVVTFGIVGRWMSEGLAFGIKTFVYQPVCDFLVGMDAWEWLSALITEGIIGGVGAILVFLPQVVLLFFFLALLEDSGYISRVAFMTDGIFRKIGLSGRSAFTMLMGFGCSATAVLTARGLEDPNMRKKTVLLTPFMSCSARLPVYSAVLSAFFVGASPLIIFGLYFLGAIIAFLLAAVFQKIGRLKSGELSFIMEMPPYRLPTLERVRQLIGANAKVFVLRVGTVIFALNVIVWLLANFCIYGYTAGSGYASFLQSLSGLIAPLFAPLGFGSWQAVSSLLSGLVAKESVLATMQSLGGMQQIFGGENAGLSALCFLIFTLLYIPCIATLSAIGKEIGYKWAVFSLALQLLVAYLAALIVRLVGLLFLTNMPLAIGILACAAVVLLVALALKHATKNKQCDRCRSCKNHCEAMK